MKYRRFGSVGGHDRIDEDGIRALWDGRFPEGIAHFFAGGRVICRADPIGGRLSIERGRRLWNFVLSFGALLHLFIEAIEVSGAVAADLDIDARR